MKNFIVFTSAQRSGATALRYAIADLGNFTDFGEVFNSDPSQQLNKSNYFYYAKNKSKLKNKFSYQDAWNEANNYLDYLESISIKNNILIDIKYQAWQTISETNWINIAQSPIFMNVLSRTSKRKLSVVHLFRKNLFNQFVSTEISRQLPKNNWHIQNQSNLELELQITRSPWYLERDGVVSYYSDTIKMKNWINESLNFLEIKHQNIEYESLYCNESKNGLTEYGFDKLKKIIDVKILNDFKIEMHKNKYNNFKIKNLDLIIEHCKKYNLKDILELILDSDYIK